MNKEMRDIELNGETVRIICANGEAYTIKDTSKDKDGHGNILIDSCNQEIRHEV